MDDDRPSAAAFDFLKRRAAWVSRSRYHFAVARLLDDFYTEQMVKGEEANREALAANIRNWVEGMQPTDLRNRSTAELQDELSRRMNDYCSHHIPWDECDECRRIHEAVGSGNNDPIS